MPINSQTPEKSLSKTKNSFYGSNLSHRGPFRAVPQLYNIFFEFLESFKANKTFCLQMLWVLFEFSEFNLIHF